MRTTTTILALTLLPSVTLHGQQTDGTLMGAPVAFGVEDGTVIGPSPADPRRIQRKRAGYVPALELPAFDPTTPIQWGALPFIDQPFEVDALSIGLDVINATTPDNGVSLIDFSASEAWATILFTVASGSPSAPGSPMEIQLASPDGNGADLFSANLPGSFFEPGVDACYPLGARLSTDAVDMGFAPIAGNEMRWVDMFISRYDAGQMANDELPDNPTVYFSLRSEDASLAPSSWFFPGFPSGATILKTTWGPGGWSTPQTHLTPFDLGLSPLLDDVDALAVDESRCKALFSIEARTGLIGEQFQIVEWPCTDSATRAAFAGGGILVGEYHSTPGKSVGRDLDLVDGSEVDGFCDEDPGDQAATCSIFLGTPAMPVFATKTLSMQVYRDDTPLGAGGTFTFVVDGVSGGPGQLMSIALFGVGAPIIVHTEPANGPARRTVSLTNALLDGPAVGTLVCLEFAVVVTPAPKNSAATVEIGTYF